MREILFRGKQIDTGEWKEGLYVRCRGHHYILPVYDEDNGFDERYSDWDEVDPETVCQYTGLTDRNGRKIFDGDIVAYMDTYSTDNGYAEADCIGKVIWCEEELCFHVTERLSAESWEVLEDCCVVGDIFNNPELVN